jgi:hypothetical protein
VDAKVRAFLADPRWVEGWLFQKRSPVFLPRKKEKKGVSVKKFPVFIEIEGASPSKF